MTQIPVVIDRASPVPLYHQLSQQLSAAIEDGTLKPGDAFENELALAERLQLSRPTVRRAIADLVTRGLIVRRRGVGTTVAAKAIHRRRDELTSLYDDLVRRGEHPRTRVLRLGTEVNPVAAEALGLPDETELVVIERLRLVDEVPTAVMHNWLPPRFADLNQADLESGSLYAQLRQRGAYPVVAHQRIGARRPTSSERKLLELDAGDPVLTMSRRAHAADGTAVEFGDHSYRYDMYTFDLTVHDAR